MWMVTLTRSNIAPAVRGLARFCENSGLAHKEAVLKVMQHLLHPKEWGITYGGQGCGFNMKAYTVSDFGACLDTKRLVSGVVVMLVKETVSWQSRIQVKTASGTSEAEYVALSEAVK